MYLKPHDTVLALKYGTLALAIAKGDEPVYAGNNPSKSTSVRWMGGMLGISPGEIAKSLKRLVSAQLVAENSQEGMKSDLYLNYHLVTRNMNEWIAYGIRYWAQPDPVGVVRGMPTGWTCPEIVSDMADPDIPLVWESGGGEERGEGIQPLYEGAPQAAKRDPALYKIMSLIDIIRVGKPRELNIARVILKKTMEDISHAQQQL